MLVQDVMQTRLVTISPRTTLPEAIRLTQQRGIRHLPVVDDGRLVGIISDRDLKLAMASPATTLDVHELAYLLNRLTVDTIMTKAVITIGPTFPLEEAARLMVREKVSALPVTESGTLVGIVTETDVLDVFVRAMGAGEPSTRLDVVVPGEGPALSRLVHAVEEAGATICSIMTLRNREGLKEAIVRVSTINPKPALAALEARGFTVREPFRS